MLPNSLLSWLFAKHRSLLPLLFFIYEMKTNNICHNVILKSRSIYCDASLFSQGPDGCL